jgi:hypothetical protein
MDRNAIIANVKIKLDESTPSGVSHSFDGYITALLDEAAKDICDTVPIHLLDAEALDVEVDSELFYEDDLAHIVVPDDFARLYEVKFANWEKPVYELSPSGSPEYMHQDQAYLKSGSGRPTVIEKYKKLADDSDPTLYLICGRVYEGEAVSIANYIAYQVAEDLPVHLHEAVAWLTTMKVLNVVGEFDAAKNAEAEYVKTISGRR